MADTLVLGLGNVLCGDEGIGCRVAEFLHATKEYPANVIIADGGTMGQELLGPVMAAHNLLIIDSVDFGLKPGESTIRPNAPMWIGAAKLSPHQGSFAEILALADLKDCRPQNITLLGIQPQLLEFGQKLSPLLAERLPAYADQAEAILEQWNKKAKLREKPIFLSDTPIALQNYEPLWAEISPLYFH